MAAMVPWCTTRQRRARPQPGSGKGSQLGTAFFQWIRLKIGKEDVQSLHINFAVAAVCLTGYRRLQMPATGLEMIAQ